MRRTHPVPILLTLVLGAGLASASRARMNLFDDDVRLITLPDDFTFPFGGVEYKGFFLCSNGNLTFGRPEPSSGTNPFAVLNGGPRIAPLNFDLDPSVGGLVTVGRLGPDEFEVCWDNVPVYGQPGTANSFAVILRRDGSFRFDYGALATTSMNTDLVVGFSAGRANTNGMGQAVVFNTMVCPAAWGTGVEPALYQNFNPTVGAGPALQNRSICFAPVLPTSGKLMLGLQWPSAEIELTGFDFPFYGNRYTSVWVNAAGSLTFGGPDSDRSPTAGEFLNRVGRIAAYWTDLNPGDGNPVNGTITVTQSPASFVVSWSNVPCFGVTGSANSFSITLFPDGSARCSYGFLTNLPPTTTPNVLVGFTGGYPVTSGSEAPAPLPNNPIPTGTPAVFQIFAVASFPGSGQQLDFNAAHAALTSPLSIGNNVTDVGFNHALVEQRFPAGFRFPFAGSLYDTVLIAADGFLSFGASDGNQGESAADHLALFPRIAVFWDDFNPLPPVTGGPEGRVTFSGTPAAVTIRWEGMPEVAPGPGQNASTFEVTLRPDGTCTILYGTVTARDGVVGFSAGGGKTSGAETAVNLSALGGNFGTGGETAIFELFTTASPFDLSGSVNVALPGSILLQALPRAATLVPLALGAPASEAGRVHVLALSLGNAGIPVFPCTRPIPLIVDSLLLLSVTVGFPVFNGFVGALDGWGQRDAWPRIPGPAASPVSLLLPAGTAGIVVHAGFVVIGPGSPPGCPFSFISPGASFTVIP